MPPTISRRTINKARNARGMQLVEMVVALGLSGVFIVLLSQMMSENMRLGTATATDQMATAAMDSLEENMLNMPYGQIENSSNQQIPVVIEDETDIAMFAFVDVRKIPMQQNLKDQILVWGGFNPFTKSIDPTNQWKKGTGPYFRGTLFKTVIDTTVESFPAKKVTLILQFMNKDSASNSRIRKKEFFVLNKSF